MVKSDRAAISMAGRGRILAGRPLTEALTNPGFWKVLGDSAWKALKGPLAVAGRFLFWAVFGEEAVHPQTHSMEKKQPPPFQSLGYRVLVPRRTPLRTWPLVNATVSLAAGRHAGERAGSTCAIDVA